MINNYLDFVKGERKRLLKESKKRFIEWKGDRDSWLKGYHRGWSCAQLCASWRWRKLQKDIEYHLSQGHVMVRVDSKTAEILDILV